MADNKPTMKARLWLPWHYTIGDQEIRLSSEDVYDALEQARMTQQYIIETKNLDVEMRLTREKNIAILKAVEDGLRSMFGQALKDTPKFQIPGGKK